MFSVTPEPGEAIDCMMHHGSVGLATGEARKRTEDGEGEGEHSSGKTMRAKMGCVNG